MTMMRLLLPFTHGIDESAIIAALALAERFGATLVVLSLSCLPEASDTGPCWQDIQQSNDFLTFVLHKAALLSRKARVTPRFVYRQQEPGVTAQMWHIVHPHNVVLTAEQAAEVGEINPDRIRYQITPQGKIVHLLKQW